MDSECEGQASRIVYKMLAEGQYHVQSPNNNAGDQTKFREMQKQQHMQTMWC